MDNKFIQDTFGLEGKVAMVTGGHTGIGRAIANGLAKAGADIFILTHSNKNIEEVRKEIESYGRKVVFGQADLSQEEAAMDVVEQCKAYVRLIY